MYDCEIKSTGFLVDELLTLDLKIAAGNTEAEARRHELANCIVARTSALIDGSDLTRYREFQKVVMELDVILTECWNAQETVMCLPEPDKCSLDQVYAIAGAAKTAQSTNRARNILVRRLDGLMNETARTQLEKTY